MLISAELKGCVTWFIYFFDLLWARYNCAKFHNCRICVTDFWEGGAFLPPPPPIREQPRKSPSWIGLMSVLVLLLFYNTWCYFSFKSPKNNNMNRIINDTHREKLQEQFNTRICRNRILAPSGYCLNKQLNFHYSITLP